MSSGEITQATNNPVIRTIPSADVASPNPATSPGAHESTFELETSRGKLLMALPLAIITAAPMVAEAGDAVDAMGGVFGGGDEEFVAHTYPGIVGAAFFGAMLMTSLVALLLKRKGHIDAIGYLRKNTELANDFAKALVSEMLTEAKAAGEVREKDARNSSWDGIEKLKDGGAVAAVKLYEKPGGLSSDAYLLVKNVCEVLDAHEADNEVSRDLSAIAPTVLLANYWDKSLQPKFAERFDFLGRMLVSEGSDLYGDTMRILSTPERLRAGLRWSPFIAYTRANVLRFAAAEHQRMGNRRGIRTEIHSEELILVRGVHKVAAAMLWHRRLIELEKHFDKLTTLYHARTDVEAAINSLDAIGETRPEWYDLPTSPLIDLRKGCHKFRLRIIEEEGSLTPPRNSVGEDADRGSLADDLSSTMGCVAASDPFEALALADGASFLLTARTPLISMV